MTNEPRIKIVCRAKDTPLLKRILELVQDFECHQDVGAESNASRQTCAQVVVIYAGRNKLYRVTVPEGSFVVKAFGRLALMRQMYYGWLGASKAKRSHEHSERLDMLGLSSVRSLGYAEQRTRLGLLARAYYVNASIEATEYDIHPHMRGWMAPEGFTESLAQFIARLHECGVIHRDLSPGNVLYRVQADGSYTFYLVDLNRMQFVSHPLSLAEASTNISRLTSRTSVTSQLATFYAGCRGWDITTTERAFSKATDSFWLGRLAKLSYRFEARRSGMSLFAFALIYLRYRLLRAIRRCPLLPQAWHTYIYKVECALYHRYLSAEDIRHALARREGYGRRLTSSPH